MIVVVDVPRGRPSNRNLTVVPTSEGVGPRRPAPIGSDAAPDQRVWDTSDGQNRRYEGESSTCHVRLLIVSLDAPVRRLRFLEYYTMWRCANSRERTLARKGSQTLL